MLRANNAPYMTKALRKAIMRRSALENKYHRYRTPEHNLAYKKQKNYCSRLYKKERKKFYANLNLTDITDNRKFWKTIKPLFSNKEPNKKKLLLSRKMKSYPKMKRFRKPLILFFFFFFYFF